jgi:hypothetical protein
MSPFVIKAVISRCLADHTRDESGANGFHVTRGASNLDLYMLRGVAEAVPGERETSSSVERAPSGDQPGHAEDHGQGGNAAISVDVTMVTVTCAHINMKLIMYCNVLFIF